METVNFFSSPGVPLVADMYLPASSPPAGGHPVVIACLGWGSVRELMAPWGLALAEAGYAVLIPDYRGFGASGGTRGQSFPAEHIDDIRASITFAGGVDTTAADRIALLGVSYGGAIAVAAGGLDVRAGAVVSVVGYGSGERHLKAVRTRQQWTEFRLRLEEDRRRRVAIGHSAEVDPDEILLRDREAREWRSRVEEEYPHMAFRTTLESAERIAEFRPERYLPYAAPKPVLLIHAENDTMIPVEESRRMWERADEPKRLVVIPGIGHHEVHTGEAFAQVIRHVDDWLREHLRGRPID
ncbi:MAG: alpha/beta hydrolase [Acidimicrobiia bacterium]